MGEQGFEEEHGCWEACCQLEYDEQWECELGFVFEYEAGGELRGGVG
jgi:hypothetical protein